MTTSEYEEPEDGEWVRPSHTSYRQRCCDCGLVHRYRFRVTGPDGVVVPGLAVEFQVERDNRATGQVRRHLKRGRA